MFFKTHFFTFVIGEFSFILDVLIFTEFVEFLKRSMVNAGFMTLSLYVL